MFVPSIVEPIISLNFIPPAIFELAIPALISFLRPNYKMGFVARIYSNIPTSLHPY